MSTVTHGLYGGVLTRDTVSLEHIKPVSQGGKTVLNNLALATKENNNKRGNEDIGKFLTFEMIRNYLAQFKGIQIKGFNGDKYIEVLKATFGGLIND